MLTEVEGPPLSHPKLATIFSGLLRKANRQMLGQYFAMHHEWLPQTPEQLRFQADKMRKLARFVRNSELARRLNEQAEALILESERRSDTGSGD